MFALATRATDYLQWGPLPQLADYRILYSTVYVVVRVT
jgi:hypothetical protein